MGSSLADFGHPTAKRNKDVPSCPTQSENCIREVSLEIIGKHDPPMPRLRLEWQVRLQKNNTSASLYEPFGDVATVSHGPYPRLRMYSLTRSSIVIWFLPRAGVESALDLNMASTYGVSPARMRALSEKVVKLPDHRSRVSAWPSISGTSEPATASVPTCLDPVSLLW